MPVENSAIIQDLTNQFDTGHFTMAEFDVALATTKMYKQPGPDKIVMELFKWMNNENKSGFLRLLNFWCLLGALLTPCSSLEECKISRNNKVLT